MECSQIPTADRWGEDPERLEEYRRHLRSCLACRRRVFAQAPDALLFELRDSTLPEGFWTGFWESLERKLPNPETVNPPARSYRVLRWAAVAAMTAFVFVVSHRIPRETPVLPTAQVHVSKVKAEEYPVVEDLQNRKATFYIIQSDPKQKIVMVYDPDMEL